MRTVASIAFPGRHQTRCNAVVFSMQVTKNPELVTCPTCIEALAADVEAALHRGLVHLETQGGSFGRGVIPTVLCGANVALLNRLTQCTASATLVTCPRCRDKMIGQLMRNV